MQPSHGVFTSEGTSFEHLLNPNLISNPRLNAEQRLRCSTQWDVPKAAVKSYDLQGKTV